MRLAALIVLTGLTLGASACGTMEPVSGAAAPTTSAPAPTEHHDWSFGSEGDQAGLVYGLEESDDVWLALSCRRGSGRLEMSRPASADHPLTISVESGGETETYPATSEPSELHDGVYLLGEARTGDRVFQRFRQSGWMTITGPDSREAMVPHPASAPGIERFFAFCG